MPSNQKFEVRCPKCNRPYYVYRSDLKFNCEIHGDFPIAWVNESIALLDIVSPKEEFMQQISSKLQKDQEKYVTKEVLESIVQNILNESPRFAPSPEIGFSKAEIQYVDRRLVEDMNETFLEAGISLGFFTLFLGILAQEVIDGGKTGALWLITIILGFITGYAYYKGFQRKKKIGVKTKPLAKPE